MVHVLQPGGVWEIVNLGRKQIGTNTQAQIRGLDFRTSSEWGWRGEGCEGRRLRGPVCFQGAEKISEGNPILRVLSIAVSSLYEQ